MVEKVTKKEDSEIITNTATVIDFTNYDNRKN